MKKSGGTFISPENFSVPKEVSHVTQTLKKYGYEAYIVGGCVRDLFIGRTPKDWDVTTNATPEQIVAIFPKTFYENDYGTVGVVNETAAGNSGDVGKAETAAPIDESLKVIEVTPYRVESGYSDKRRPDKVSFSKKIEDDLKRRDFTFNAVAYDVENGQVVDLFDGLKDLDKKILRAVGEPTERFSEDALRILRAVRIHAELGFAIEAETQKAMKEHTGLLKHIAKERVREEFSRIIMSPHPKEAIELCQELGILSFIIPELPAAIGVKQNQAHAFDVWTHLLKTVGHSAKKGWPLHIRLAALLHDISKPETRRWSDEKKDWTFHGHDVVGARVAEQVLKNLKYPKDLIDRVVKLVRWHMFFSDTEKITLSAVRRLVANVGPENVWDLMNVRICDRIGTGRPKESPYRLRKYHSMVDEAMRDPISVAMLRINGAKIIEVADEKPGPRIGYILHALLEEVLDDPKLNEAEKLENRARELAGLSDTELQKIGDAGKAKKREEEERVVKEIRKKHWVE